MGDKGKKAREQGQKQKAKRVFQESKAKEGKNHKESLASKSGWMAKISVSARKHQGR